MLFIIIVKAIVMRWLYFKAFLTENSSHFNRITHPAGYTGDPFETTVVQA